MTSPLDLKNLKWRNQELQLENKINQIAKGATPVGITISAADSPDFAKNISDYICDGINDEVEWQAAIDAAQDEQIRTGFNTGVPNIYVMPGQYRWSNPISWRSAPIIGTKANVGVRVHWDGPSSGTVITKLSGQAPHPTGAAGGASWGLLSGISFREGAGTPDTWLDATASQIVDNHFFLDDIQFIGSNLDMVLINGVVNCHWTRMRFDGAGGYAIRITNDPTAFLGTFHLSDFTYDNGLTGGTGVVVLEGGNNANFGTVVLDDGRIELNSAWTSPAGIFVVERPSSTNARSAGFKLEDITFQDVTATNNSVVLYRSTSNTTGSESLILDNFRQSGLANVFGGTFPSWHGQPPLLNNYGRLDWNPNGNGNATISSGMTVRNRNDANHIPFRSGKMTDAQDRFRVDNDGNILLGDGTVVPVQALRRRITGWTAPTGVASRAGYATSTATLQEVAETLKALIDDLHGTAGHGLIGT